MNPVAAPAERSFRNRQDKYDERRVQLAESALATLGELGYARTSLREIAQNSPFSHGVVHYYFKNKTALILHCVRYYKSRCMTRYDEIVDTALTADELRRGFADKLLETLRTEAPMHRLWYDLRNQAMFDPELREDVSAIDNGLCDMIDRVLTRYAELSDAVPRYDRNVAYSMLDGIFLAALLEHLIERDARTEAGETDDASATESSDRLRDKAFTLLPDLVAAP
ncbi:TetR/AcrR family transcriptional regulator [Rhodococcus artemisiae]|uniref:TetR/AcrR family transcriptional regulator n=1 Tax=Rhodococcus artemisiae TaxID=714159 RepID=A0ABU7LDL7_9NOCA|nr:TetR/AcrR family transcriptional regulator [Rhodococcus artemisiae]MEE2059638.1 TetR/AcrR family transcriptional regulator [Rhodococcus artemisiae]